jgi:hypothetical protein
MRKISIGIFTLATVIIFFLSTSISVTAATHQETIMILESDVWDDSPYAEVSIDPQDVWTYADWEWTVEINNGDDVIIDTTCNWLNSVYPGWQWSGYHYFNVTASYVKGLDAREDTADLFVYTFGLISSEPDAGSDTITVAFYNVERGGTIYLYWYVYAINYDQNPDVEAEDEHTGTVYLT